MLKYFSADFRRLLTLLAHVVLAAAAFIGAFAMRFDGIIPASFLTTMLSLILPFIVIKMLFVFLFSLHRGMWRYAGMHDLELVVKTATASTVLCVLWVVATGQLVGFPRSIFLLDWLSTIAMFGGMRFAVRRIREKSQRGLMLPEGVPTLIIGAGDTGESALRALLHDQHHQHQVVGFLDDDPNKKDAILNGFPVLGTINDAAKIISEQKVEEVIIAIPVTGKRVLRMLVERCGSQKIRYRIVPAILDVLSGKISLDRMRDVRVEDLLGRDQIFIDAAPVKTQVTGKVVLITGAGGSIGSEIARQIAAYGPANLVLLDIGETPLFEIDRELRETHPLLSITPVFCDIKNRARLQEIFSEYRPQFVYHAAAYKHVPLMESHPVEAVNNNVFGTRNVAEIACACGVQKFVMISTDKAVTPKSVMGATKRCAELLLHGMSGRGTEFIVVRFGNVLGSNGSVVPIFRQQIEKGGPITVTHPDVTRYFMTIPEAVELVLQAGVIGHDSDLFMLEMGDPVRITDLAKNMIELSGHTVGEDIEIHFSGLRPGEKLHEELAYTHEDVTPTDIPKLLRHREVETVPAAFATLLEDLKTAAAKGDDSETRTLLWRAMALPVTAA